MRSLQANINTRVVTVGIILALLIDVSAKYVANTLFHQQAWFSYKEIFTFILFKNTSGAFGIPIPIPLLIFLSAIGLALILSYRKRLQPSNAILAVCCGGLSNTIDRLINGFTTDYLVFWHISAWNIADLLICAGLFSLFLYSRRRAHSS